MNDIDDPRRLFERDDAPTELRALLARALDDVLPAAAVADLASRAEQRARAPMAKPSWARWTSRRSTKIMLAAALVGVGGAAWLWGGSPSPSGVPAGTEKAPVVQAPAVLTTEPGQASSMESGENTVPAEAARVVQPRSPSSRPARASHGRGAGETDTAVSVATEVASADEYRLLRSARQAIGDAPARALQLTDEHRHRFARGMLAQEREAIAVEALVRLGRSSEGRVRAQAFFADYPSSPYRVRVERAVSASSVNQR